MRAIVLLGRFWGANLPLGDEAPGIVAQLAGFGWELTFASAAPPAAPCPNVARFGAGALPGPQERCSDIADVEAYDALIVAPGRDYSDLLVDGAALDLVRRAFAAGVITSYSIHYTKLYDLVVRRQLDAEPAALGPLVPEPLPVAGLEHLVGPVLEAPAVRIDVRVR